MPNESAAEPIRVRVGQNAGEPIAEAYPDGRSDLFGTAVNLAARIAGKDFLFAHRGEVALKGFDEPVRLYEVRRRE